MKKFLIALVLLITGLGLNSCGFDDSQTNSYEENLNKGLEYLTNNAKRENVKVTPTGLQYEVLVEGTGRSPQKTDNVKCNYEGRFVDGTVFDSSYKTGKPAVFPLDKVIPGWTEGLQLMKEGAKYRLSLPYQLGYGAYGYATIPPYSALIFDVELLEVL